MYQIIKYIQYLWRSKNHHGVHSPFVFKLLTEGLYKGLSSEVKEKLKKHKNYHLKNQLKIEVEDFGAGSRVFKNNHRSIEEIARVAGMPSKEQLTMAKLTRYLKPANVLELGTSLGLGTAAMHLGHPEGRITTVERCKNTLAEAKKGFAHFNFQQIDTVNALFTDFLNEDQQKWDLVYLDGGHTEDFTLYTFEQLLPKMHNDSLIIIDDIYWSKGMTVAWEQIKQHPKVGITIDSYDWGWVFFRKEQAKEHFTLRV